MSGPPAKKQKVTEAIEPAPPPIIFKVAGMKCDTRLMVFRQEFQVHSMVLKLHSAFFRKFMDSPKKKGQVPQDGFQYNWTTSVDEDGTGWQLVSTTDYSNLASQDKFNKLFMDTQQKHFERLLCAFYAKPYKVNSIDDLSELTGLADYYCCLRILSNTVNGAILANQNAVKWYQDLQRDREKSLETAMKLRSPMLFQDALILAVSCYCHIRDILPITNPKLALILRHAYDRIGVLVAEAFVSCIHCREEIDAAILCKCADNCQDGDGGLAVPEYFQELRDITAIRSLGIKALDEVLQCNLAFQLEDYKAGLGDHYDSFFCATIPDDELPWDIKDEDY